MSIVEVVTDFSSTMYKLDLVPDYTKHRGSIFYQHLRDYWMKEITKGKLVIL